MHGKLLFDATLCETGAGVLTKLDIMDRGTNAAAILRNDVVPLRLGYVGVVLRSQEDIATRRGMGEARETERAFFASRPEYSGVAAACSVGTLARRLNGILVDTIRDMLPSLRAKVEDALSARRRELRLYGEAPPGHTGAAQGALLLSVLDSYSSRFAEALDGQGEHLPVTELAGGARIRHIFQEIFTAGLEGLDPMAELSDEDVRTAIKNSGGIKGTLLIPEAPFELLVRRAIDRLLAPSLQCKEFVHAELLRIAAQCVPPDVARFPVLQTVLAEAVEEFVNAGAGPAEAMIRNMVACELAYINTSHPGFIGGNRAIAQVLERRAAGGEESSGDEAAQVGPTGRIKVPRAHPVVTSNEPAGLAAAAKLTGRGMEPEVFNPEDLLATARAGKGLALTPRQEGGEAPLGWFSNLFGRGGGAAEAAAEHTSPTEALLRRPPPTLRVPKAVSDQEEVQVEVTRVLVDSYFDIVRKNLQDAVPKALMHFLVNHVRKGLQQHLIRSLYREELFGEIMTERDDVAAKRQQCQEAQRMLRHALKTLEALPAELIGRVNASGARYSFKQMMNEVDAVEAADGGAKIPAASGGAKGRSSSPLKSGLKDRAAKAASAHKTLAVAAMAGGGEVGYELRR